MEATLIQTLHSARLTRREIQSLAARLPSSQEELNRLIGSLIASADEFVATLKAEFGLELPEAAALWPSICAKHDELFEEPAKS